MTGLCWINVELFISDWVGPPSSKPTPNPVYVTLGNNRDEQFLLYIYADQHRPASYCIMDVFRLYLLLANYFFSYSLAQ